MNGALRVQSLQARTSRTSARGRELVCYASFMRSKVQEEMQRPGCERFEATLPGKRCHPNPGAAGKVPDFADNGTMADCQAPREPTSGA